MVPGAVLGQNVRSHFGPSPLVPLFLACEETAALPFFHAIKVHRVEAPQCVVRSLGIHAFLDRLGGPRALAWRWSAVGGPRSKHPRVLDRLGGARALAWRWSAVGGPRSKHPRVLDRLGGARALALRCPHGPRCQ